MKADIAEYIESIVTANDKDLEIISHILEYAEQTFLKRPLTVDELKIAVSSGNSYVVIIDGLDIVFQYYTKPAVYDRVATFIDGMIKTTIIKPINIGSGFGRRRVVEAELTIQYDLKKYMVFDYLKLPEIQTIIWHKIVAINSIIGLHDSDPLFIADNLEKILWDLGKSMWGIHQNKFVHGDTSIDNAGILGDNIAYFDYDSSKNLIEYDTKAATNLMKLDEKKLLDSVNYHLDIDLSPAFGQYGDFLTNVLKWVKHEHNFATYEETMKYLESLPIQFLD